MQSIWGAESAPPSRRLLMLALGLSVAVDGVTDSYARYGLLASPGAAPAVTHLRALGDTFALWPACIGFILLLTPTGWLPSARWRWWAGIAVAAPLSWKAATVLGFETVEFPPFYSFRNPYHVPALAAPAMAVALPALVLTLLSVVVGGASLVVRFRQARGEERQQLRWVASAAVVAAVGIPVAMAGISIESPALVGVAVLGSAAVLCLAIAAAILNYRLYDLDRILSRTLAYGSSPCCWPAATPGWCWGWADWWATTPAWSWREPRWPWRRSSSRLAAAFSRRSTSGSTGAATTPPGPSPPSPPASVTRST
jgi:hypothetical protein